MTKENFKGNWSSKAPKQLTEDFINYVATHYYGSYKKESFKYEKRNNNIFLLVALIGLLIALLLGVQEFLREKVWEWISIGIKISVFILPLISSFLLLFSNQKGYKRKEELREDARIHSKFLVNEARLRFSVAKTDEDYSAIYQWLNEEILKLQLNQATDYFTVHNNKNNER